MILVSSKASIKRLYLENIRQTTAEGATAPFFDVRGEIGELIERDVKR